MIYFIQDSDTLAIRIIQSDRSAAGEIEEMSKYCPNELILAGSLPGNVEDLFDIYNMIKPAERAFVGNNWFKPTPSVLAALTRVNRDRYSSIMEITSNYQAMEKESLSIYMAGKISKHDWRHSIVSPIDINDVEGGDTGCVSSGPVALPRSWPVLEKAIFGQHHYTGPFFIRCDHGCYHGSNSHGAAARDVDIETVDTWWCKNCHGSGSDGPCGEYCQLISQEEPIERSHKVVSLCQKAIAASDVFFAWVDAPDCYGTLVEAGYAAALGKVVWVAGPEPYRDMWFLYAMADSLRFGVGGPELALRQFCGKGGH